MMGINALEMGYVGLDGSGSTDFRITKDKCILCGACAVNCPSDAIKVVERSDERILSLCGTILNRQKLIYCNSCGEPVGTDQYVDYLKNRLSTTSQVKYDKNLCGVCARKERATSTNQWGVLSISRGPDQDIHTFRLENLWDIAISTVF